MDLLCRIQHNLCLSALLLLEIQYRKGFICNAKYKIPFTPTTKAISLETCYRIKELTRIYTQSNQSNTYKANPTSKPCHKIMFYISLLNHCYWIAGCVCGTILGNEISFIRDIQGLDFIVVATFCVLLYENMRLKENMLPIAIGVFGTLFCFVLDREHFLSYALVMIVCVLLIVRKYMQKRGI